MARDRNRWRVVALLALGIALGIALTATPATSHVAGWAHNWKQHIRPKADARYLPGGNLPRGKTIRGSYATRGSSSPLGSSAASISFGYTLRKAPTPHLVTVGQTPPAACPGSAANPKAAVGHLCVYERTSSNVSGYSIVNPATNQSNSASRWGAALFVLSTSQGTFLSIGTWAVRAP